MWTRADGWAGSGLVADGRDLRRAGDHAGREEQIKRLHLSCLDVRVHPADRASAGSGTSTVSRELRRIATRFGATVGSMRTVARPLVVWDRDCCGPLGWLRATAPRCAPGRDHRRPSTAHRTAPAEVRASDAGQELW
jgi:hypothetical protein